MTRNFPSALPKLPSINYWHFDLTWYPAEPRSVRPWPSHRYVHENTPPSLPSWSWASFPSAITWGTVDGRGMFETNKINTFELVPVKPLAHLRGMSVSQEFNYFDGASLDIGCLRIPAALGSKHSSEFLSLKGPSQTVPEDDLSGTCHGPLFTGLYGQKAWSGLRVNFSRACHSSLPCYVVPLYCGRKENEVRGIVIQQETSCGCVRQEGIQRFARIGMFESDGTEAERPLSQLILNTILKEVPRPELKDGEKEKLSAAELFEFRLRCDAETGRSMVVDGNPVNRCSLGYIKAKWGEIRLV